MMGRVASKLLMLLLAGAAAQSVSLAQEAFPIDFNRPLRPGMRFACDVRAEHSRRYSISMPGVEEPVARFEMVQANVSGTMRVVSVNESGNSLTADFEVASLSGAIDGASVDFPDLKGATVSANMGKTPCEFSVKGSSVPLDKRAATLLSTVFRPASKDTLKDILGAEKPLAIGEKWSPSPNALIASLARRKVAASAESIETSATLVAKERFKDIDCWKIDGLIQSKGVPGFDFRLSLSILLPCDPKLGGALKISRTGMEIVNRSLPDNPLSAGKAIEAVVKDSMAAELTPLPDAPAK